ncbi:MAG: diadenylate cyclase CdaA [Synergistaceae bacterium]|jgi:diadenylate cyclase|nr:diadenylate cyclase CdaA [Synergistaceae bacterium]
MQILSTLRTFLDIFIVAAVIYRILVLLVGTRAVQLVKGMMILAVFYALSYQLHFLLVSWIMEKVFWALIFAIPIVFQPELRKMLEELGQGGFWADRVGTEEAERRSLEVTKALSFMKSQKIGALLVLERKTGLKEYWSTATKLDAQISQDLIISLFWKNNPLHDGAVIMNREEIIAAGCILPVSDNPDIWRWLGTRHRAGLGISEVSDAMVLIVSEESGKLSLAFKGRISRDLNDVQVQRLLMSYFTWGADKRDGGLKDRLKGLLSRFWVRRGVKAEGVR